MMPVEMQQRRRRAATIDRLRDPPGDRPPSRLRRLSILVRQIADRAWSQIDERRRVDLSGLQYHDDFVMDWRSYT
jgi:hypothetical protein